MSSEPAAISTASEIAIPRLPESCSACERPASVSSDGLRWTVAAPGLDHRPAVGLLVVGDADHEHLAFELEHLTGERQRRAPLPGAGLGRELANPGLRVVERLRDRGVRLVRARRRDALVLVVDVGRRIQGPFEPASTQQRRRAPKLVDLADLVRDLDLGLGRDLLLDQRHRKQRRQVLRPQRLLGSGMKRRQRVAGQIGHQVDPVGRDRGLGQQELGLLAGAHAGLLSAHRSCAILRVRPSGGDRRRDYDVGDRSDHRGGGPRRSPSLRGCQRRQSALHVAGLRGAVRRRRHDRGDLADRPAPGVVQRDGAVGQRRAQLCRGA